MRVVHDVLFGTDGIRGQTSLEEIDEAASIDRLEQDRTLTPAFMRLVGEALSTASRRCLVKATRSSLDGTIDHTTPHWSPP